MTIGTMIFGGDANRDALLKVARKQSSVLAVANLAKDDLGTEEAKSFAQSTKLTVTSQQQTLLTQIPKAKKKDYTAGANQKTIADLETAQRNGRFDEAFLTAMKQALTEYQNELQAANIAVSNKKSKALLSKDFESVGILLSIPTNSVIRVSD
jgi:NADH:ubiquinone oxidoreductase subunit C